MVWNGIRGCSDRLARARCPLELAARRSLSSSFFAERIEADRVHEQLVRQRAISPPRAADPARASDVMVGIQTSTPLTDRLFDVPAQHPRTVHMDADAPSALPTSGLMDACAPCGPPVSGLMDACAPFRQVRGAAESNGHRSQLACKQP